MAIGLQRGTVQLQAYHSGWIIEFEQEKQHLLDLFGDKIIAVEHIGSTAIPGLPAKPIIDIIAGIHSFNEFADFIKPLEELGYEYMPQRMFPERKFFPKGPRTHRTHHLNLVMKDDPEQWLAPLLFRDYLREHTQAKNEYAQLKASLAIQYSDNRAAYTAAKHDFIQRILHLANTR